jgi:hypothetical protein
MNIVIIMQNDPFYLVENIDYLFTRLSKDTKVIGCVLTDVPPLGNNEAFLEKLNKICHVF